MQTQNRIYAKVSDFKRLGPEFDDSLRYYWLKDLRYARANLETLKRIFTKLERRGVRIPTAYFESDNGPNVSPKRDWYNLVGDIEDGYQRLTAIVSAVLDECQRDRDSISVCSS
jgi:hypothetical protein